MNTNELMLWNYVMYANQLRVVTCISLTEVRISRKTGKRNFVITNIKYNDDELKPIPLTEKWLLDFGFFNKGNEIVNQYEENTHVFCLGENNKIKIKFRKEWYGDTKENSVFEIIFYRGDDFICGLKYVHQLQNSYFALSGYPLQLVEPK